MRGRTTAAVLGLVAALLLPGCSDGGAETPATTTTTTAPSTTAAEAAGSTTTEEPIAIVLGAGRLTVGGNALVFDAPAFQVSAYLERALGDPDDEDDEDCGPGRLHLLRWDGLDVFLLDDRLVGWSVDDDTRTTDTKITLGSTKAELTAAYPTVTFPESTLGEEFFVPPTGQDTAGLSGVLEGDEVVALWSGATCVAR